MIVALPHLLSVIRPLHLILLLIPIGVAFRYCVELTESGWINWIGVSVSGELSMEENRLQDAVTLTGLKKWFFLTMALQIGAVGWLWLAFGWANALIGALVAFLSGTVAQATFLPK